MLLYTRSVPIKTPKRRSRAGCVHCKEKKKKCNEARPQCDRCIERGLSCEYEPIKPRKRRRTNTISAPEQDQGESTGGSDNGRYPSIDSAPSPLQEEWDEVVPITEFDSNSNCYDLVLANDNDTYFNDVPETSLAKRNTRPFYLDTIGENCLLLGESSMVAGSRSPNCPDLAMITPATNGSPIDICIPAFSEFTPKKSQRALMDHFCHVLSHRIAFKENTANPFRQLILPLSLRSPTLFNALLATSSAHLEVREITIDGRSLDYQNQAIQGLTKLIAEENSDRDELLAVIMLLVYYEVVRSGSSAILNSHLRGALSIMKSLGTSTTPVGIFLQQAFKYFDVICALSFGTSPISGSIAPAPAHEEEGSQQSNPMSTVDPLFGFVTDLWPVIHRLARLAEFKEEIKRVELTNPAKATIMWQEFQTTSSTLELALQQWAPVLPCSTGTPSEDAKLQSILNNAEAYRQAAFVYLYRTVHSFSRKSPEVQGPAKRCLQACLRVVVFGGPRAALVWPIFMVSVEAVEHVDRDVARTVYRHVLDYQGMRNIVHAWEVTEEVWRRVDTGDEEVTWKEICDAKGMEIVFG